MILYHYDHVSGANLHDFVAQREGVKQNLWLNRRILEYKYSGNKFSLSYSEV